MTDSPLLAALAERIPIADVSFRTRMLEIAADLPDVISLGRGDPDFHTPRHIVEAAKAALDDNQHHYTHPAGLLQLREAIAEKLRRENNLDYGADEIIVTGGAQEAMLLCMLALIDEGDEVLLPSPGYSSYINDIRFFGGVPVPVPTHEAHDFALMPEEIEGRITDRTKVLVLVTPNNPTGAVTPPNVIREIAEVTKQHNLVVISDEIYSGLIFEGSEHLSIASLPDMKARTITVNGFSKTYAMTGWRVGYLAAPQPFIRLLIEPRHTFSISASTPSQFAALAAVTGPQEPVEAMRQAYAERRNYMMDALDEIGMTYGYPAGGFYVYANISTTGLPAPEFCERLLREAHVLIYPATMFGDESGKYVRISLLQPLDRIKEAASRMKRMLATYQTTARQKL
ncbi:MAG: pyridoxal phosphate-dependent aminotransferase [Chloroflexota bacterium]|nr:pyridoxal phosphate-dependent aminotransferase [Chloroflexota bacterium]